MSSTAEKIKLLLFLYSAGVFLLAAHRLWWGLRISTFLGQIYLQFTGITFTFKVYIVG